MTADDRTEAQPGSGLGRQCHRRTQEDQDDNARLLEIARQPSILVESSHSSYAAGRRLTIYRDDSTVQVVYDHVKAVFWTAGNSVLVVSQYTDPATGAHRYIHWPRERFCWFKDEPR